MKSLRILFVISLATMSWAPSARAQFEPSHLVSGTGSVTISRMPETMRLQIAVIGRGATLKDALAALKDRTGKARTQLVSLGVDKDSIQVGDPKVTEMATNQNQRMQMMMRARRGGGKAQPKNTPSPPILVMAQVSADWKLSSKTNEELLLAVHPLQEKVKATDIAGLKDAEKLTPEQEEMLEEADESYGYSSSDERKPGTPVFLFISKVSEAEREQAMTDAFAKAKAQATRLAKAAGTKLGSLQSLSGAGAAGSDYEGYGGGNGYDAHVYRALQMSRRQQQGNTSSGDESAEAIGAEAGLVNYHVSITASFNLEPQK